MGHFEPLIPLSSLYPACVDIIMADLVAIALRDFPPESRDLILAADEAAQTGLATNFPAADKQVLFLVKTVTVIVRRYFTLIYSRLRVILARRQTDPSRCCDDLCVLRTRFVFCQQA